MEIQEKSIRPPWSKFYCFHLSVDSKAWRPTLYILIDKRAMLLLCNTVVYSCKYAVALNTTTQSIERVTHNSTGRIAFSCRVLGTASLYILHDCILVLTWCCHDCIDDTQAKRNVMFDRRLMFVVGVISLRVYVENVLDRGMNSSQQNWNTIVRLCKISRAKK